MTSGIEIVRRYLTDQDVLFELIEHQDTFAAAAEARATGFDPHETAKTIILHDRARLMAAVIPASETLDVRKARALLGGTGHLRLATEDEIERTVPDLETGALPPFPGLLALPEVLDRRLLECERILCSGGDHRHSVALSPRALDRLGAPLIGDICE
jgi:Ala-tRNA(Pro) deacylase